MASALSPDGQRVSFHLASPQGYQVWTSDTDGKNRVRIAAQPGHLYFGTCWSPDGRRILYVDCHYGEDPGHDWADVCVGRADGSEHRVLTSGQSMWFAATYGGPTTRGGGSNVPAWTRDGSILFPRASPDPRCPGNTSHTDRMWTISTVITSPNSSGEAARFASSIYVTDASPF